MISRSTEGYHARMRSRLLHAFLCLGLDTAVTIKRVDTERRAETNSLGRTCDGTTGISAFGWVDFRDISGV